MTIEMSIDQPVIETERFSLRPLRRSDVGLLTMYASDARVAHNTTTIPHPLPPGVIEAFIERSLTPGSDRRCLGDGRHGGRVCPNCWA